MLTATCVASVIGVLLLALDSRAQLAYESTYPFSSPAAVASDPSDKMVFVGSGSGLLVLDASGVHGNPTLPTSGEPRLHANGMARDIAFTADHVYVAAGRNGLDRFERGQSTQEPEVDLQSIGNAWAVDVAAHDLDGQDLVFVGTNEDEAGGVLHLVHADLSSSTTSDEDFVSLGAPIYSIASRLNGDALTLLVGTGCGLVSNGGSPPALAPASVWRYDFDLSSGLPASIPTQSALWAAQISSGSLLVSVDTFVRDIVIDAATNKAYVAAFTRGIFKLDLTGSGLSQVNASGWPIVATGGSFARWDGLALYDGSLGKILVAALGPTFSSERLWWNDCTFPVPCDFTTCPTPESPFCNEKGNMDDGLDGVKLFDISGTSPAEIGSIDGHATRQTPPMDPSEFMPGPPLKVAVFETSAGALRIHAACDQEGKLTVVEGDPSTSPWTVTHIGDWNTSSDVPIVGSCDDAFQIGDDLFVTNETSVSVFDITATDPLGEPLDVSTSGGVLLSGFEAVGSYPTSLFASAQTGGINAFTWNPTTPELKSTGLFVPHGVGRVYDTFTLAPGQTSQVNKPWIFLLSGDASTLTGCPTGGSLIQNQSVRAYSLNFSGTPYELSSLGFIGGFQPSVCSSDGGNFFGCRVVRSGSSNDYAVWIPYSPLDNGTDGNGTHHYTADSGLIAMTATWSSSSGLSFGTPTKVQAFANPVGGGKPGRIRYDAASSKIYVAFACDGLAVFSVSSSVLSIPSAPETWSPSPGEAISLLDAWPGPGNNVYVAELSGDILVFDATDIASGPIATLPSRGQPTGLWPAATSSGAAFWLADSRAGVHKIVIDPTP